MQSESWQKYVLENMISVLDPAKNEHQLGSNQMLSLTALCMPTSTEKTQDVELTSKLLEVAIPMLKATPQSCEESVPFEAPKGILTDVDPAVLDGWTEHYKQPFTVSLSSDGNAMVPPISAGAEWIAMGAIDTSTNKILVCAFGEASKVFTVTNSNGTTESVQLTAD